MSNFLEIYFGYIAFFTGASFASFMNVMVYRIPLGKSVANPPSACPNCNHKIKWYENIPVFSWLFLKGSCSSCKVKISPQYVLTECLFGVFTLWFVFQVGLENLSNYHHIALYFLIYFLLTLSLIDLKYKLVPVSLLILAFISGILVPENLADSLLYGFASLGFFYMFRLIYEYFREKEVLGDGDFPILALFGSLFGLQMEFSYALALSSLAGLIMACAIFYKNKELVVPFIPALSIGLIGTYLFKIFY